MDEESRAIFKQVLKRLENIDCQQQKLDRVMERLDTLQCILERQNQKQNLLDEKLAEVTVKLEQKTTVTTEQQQGAQQEIAKTICVVDSQDISSLHHANATQPLQDWGKNINDKLKSIEDITVDTAEKYQHLTSVSSNIEGKVTKLVENEVETMKTFLLEIRSVKDLIKGQTNSELIFLNNQLDKKLSDIGSVVRDFHQRQNEAKEKTFGSARQVVETSIQRVEQQGTTHELVAAKISDKQTQAILDLERQIQQLDSSVLEVPREIKTSLDTILTTYTRFLTDFEKTIKDSISEMNKNAKEQTLLVNKIVQSEQMIREHTVSNRRLQEFTGDLKVIMNEMKLEISAVIKKEAMLVRNQMQGLVKSEEMYPFFGALLFAWFLYRMMFF